MDRHSSAKHLQDLKKTIDVVFKSPAGQDLMKFLKEQYVHKSVVQRTPEMTYYSLGQKELVEFLEMVYNEEIEIPDEEVLSDFD